MSNISSKIQGLLGNPAFNMGVGLLAAGQRRQGPRTSFGQGLLEASQYANSQMSQANQLQAQRQALQQKQQQQQAINRIGQIQQRGLLSPMAGAQALMGNIPQSIARPGLLQNATNQMAAGQNNHISGLLAQANPQAFTQAAIAQQFAPPPQQPSSLREFFAAQDMPDGMREAYLQFAGNGVSAVDQARLLEIQQNTARASQDSLRENAEYKSQALTSQNGRVASLNELEKLVGIMEGVGGTLAQTGGWSDVIQRGASGWSSLGRIGGFDTSTANKVATSLGDLDKGFNRLIGVTIPDAFLGSNQRLQFYQAQSPGIDQEFGVNLGIMKQLAQDVVMAEQSAAPVLGALGIDPKSDLQQEAERIIQRINLIEAQMALPPGARIDR